MKRLKDCKPKADALIRPFWYPEGCDEATGFRVTIQYISPSKFNELQEQIKARFSKDQRPSDTPPATLRQNIINELLLNAVIKCDGVTYGKLSALVPLDSEVIAQDGGLDGVVAMDPTNPSMATQARENLLYLLDESAAFSQWAMNVCQNLKLFQGSDWEERVKNFKSGQLSSGEVSATDGPATVRNARNSTSD